MTILICLSLTFDTYAESKQSLVSAIFVVASLPWFIGTVSIFHVQPFKNIVIFMWLRRLMYIKLKCEVLDQIQTFVNPQYFYLLYLLNKTGNVKRVSYNLYLHLALRNQCTMITVLSQQ